MSRFRNMSILVVFAFLSTTAISAWCEGLAVLPGMERTALDRYVAQPDPNYRYELVNTIQDPEYTAYVLDMISQSWRSPNEVDRTLWQHWLTIICPKEIDSTVGLLFIGGGNNGKKPPSKVDGMLSEIAKKTKSVVAELRMVPNQPIKVADEWMEKYREKGRVEDEFISYTWDKYLKTGDELWPARLPMTKSAVRAMDTVTLFCASEAGGKIPVDRFVVAGGSKRGWTTWMTAAVDPRVIAIVPIVIDLLNLQVSFEHHWQAYGFWAPAVGDYVEMGIMDHIGDPRFADLMKLVEPFEYRSRFTMPKFLINATGDQFFLPDSSQFYFDQLPGVKYLRYVPNADHGLDDTDAAESLSAFYEAILYGRPLPEFSWSFPRKNVVQVKTEQTPDEVKLWQATNPNARDFRLETLGKVWQETAIAPKREGIYTAKVAVPEKGWTAFLVELTYRGDGPTPMKFTTPVRVIPDDLPYPSPLKGR
ncbi:MAG TPA: PhoPQ-activated pathogenicity-related family protein [bacterium]|nr:PhoPQ-activated pathogenicity-related family protein [bacterium]